MSYTCDDCGYNWQQNMEVICIQCGGTNLLDKEERDEHTTRPPGQDYDGKPGSPDG